MEYLAKFDENGVRGVTYAEGVHYKDASDPKRQAWINEGFVPISPDEWETYTSPTGGKNGTGYIRDPETGRPADAPAFYSLAEAKASRIAEFKLKRDQKEVDVIEYGGNSFDYDGKARERLGIARAALEDAGGGSIVWTTADNERVTLTLADFIGINAAAAERSNALHVKYNELKDLINAAETIEDAISVKWED